MLEILDVHKNFGENQILNGINLSVEKGDVISILGPSGSGKTTLLRCMNFLEKADKGTMIFDGEKINLAAPKKKEILKTRLKTGFVFQNYNLFRNKTALENVTEGLIIVRKFDKKSAEEIGKKALDRVGLSEKYNFYPHQLSGGQQQRVGIARAIASEPEVIFFDEPTSALDPELIGEVLNVIKNLAKDGMTMIIVTHEISFARDVSTKVIFMDGGNVLESGTPENVIANPKNERTRQFFRRINQDYDFVI